MYMCNYICNDAVIMSCCPMLTSGPFLLLFSHCLAVAFKHPHAVHTAEDTQPLSYIVPRALLSYFKYTMN